MVPSKLRVLSLMTLLFLSPADVRAESDELADKVGAFAATIAASEASAKPDAKGKKAPPTKAGRESDIKQRQETVGRALMQLRLLESAIRRNDLDTTQRITGSLSSHDALPQTPGNWNDFLAEVTAGIEERVKKSDEQWYAEVRELAKATHETCLAANHSADLDAILMRTAVIQMKRMPRQNVLMQRGMTMINGIVSSLQNWARYLDQRDAGNRNAANEILRNFSRSGSEFPVISADEIRSKLLPAEVETTFKNQIDEILISLKTLEDLPAVIERWKAFQAAPQASKGDLNQVAAMNAKFDLLLRASNELKAGNGADALALASDPSLLSGHPDMFPYLKPLINQIVEGVLAAKISVLIGPQPAFAANPGKATNDALTALKQKGDYQSLLELLKLQQGRPSRDTNIAIAPVEHFLAARRFESSGDVMMAVSEYRSVVAAPAGPWLPQTEATEALQRLQKDNPDAFKDNNSVLLQELRTLREQLNQLRETRYPGGRNW